MDIWLVYNYTKGRPYVDGIFSTLEKAWNFIEDSAKQFFNDAWHYNESNRVIFCNITQRCFEIFTKGDTSKPFVVYEIEKRTVE